MKKYLIIAIAALVAFTACKKDPVAAPLENAGDVVLTFTSVRPQIDVATKTAWNAESQSIVWTEGDKIKVGFTFDGAWWAQTDAYSSENLSPNNHIKFYQSEGVTIDEASSNIGTFTVPSGNGKFTGPSTNGSFVFYAVYPASLVDNSLDSAPSANVTLKTSQEPSANSFDASTDIMVGISEAIPSTGLPEEPIELDWKRVVAHADLTFSNMAFEGLEVPNRITLTFNDEAKVAGTFSVNIADGTITAGSANEIILEGNGLTVSGSSINAWATVLPVSFTSLNVEIKTDLATYTRSITGISKTFKQNARNTLTINMETAKRVVAEQYYWVKKNLSAITSDDVFVIVGNNGANYAMSNDKGTSAAPDAVAVTVADNKLATTPADKLQWNLANDNGSYTFYPNGTTETWLYCTNTNNGVRVGTNANKVFTVTDGYLVHSGTNRYVGIYSENTVAKDWRCYTAINTNITGQTFAFYVRTSTADYKPTPTISFGTPTTEVNLGETVTNVATISVSGLPVAYVSSNSEVASVNASTGEVTGESVGTATITAYFAGNDSYEEASASYEISVVNPNTNDGSLEHPYTASEAAALALSGDTGTYYITGTITSVIYQYDAEHGTATFWLSEEGDAQTFEGYKIKYFNDVNWLDGDIELEAGDEVIINGPLKLYNTVPETNGGYLVSLNGKQALSIPSLSVNTNTNNKQIIVTWGAATGSDGTVSYTVTCGSQTYTATTAGSHTFTMASAGTYDVSVIASASDAYSSAASTSVTLNSSTQPVTLIIDGSQLTSTATTSVVTKTYDGVSVIFSEGAKQQSSTGDNRFTDKAILIGKTNKYINAAIPGTITKFEIYANKGASANVSVGVNFSATKINSYNSSAQNTYKATLSVIDNVYDCSASLPSDAKYFWYQVTNNYNSQVEFRITYIPD